MSQNNFRLESVENFKMTCVAIAGGVSLLTFVTWFKIEVFRASLASAGTS